ncbi:MAG: hypothetical protein U1C04_22535 [Hydrogenophaga sp.]|uniref:hypothetical protein n=1 Tax=Hydrogenophaga sp. TaxID=1904254 RepID=UPI002AB94B97|nr:hypothetical protein [Hydrogenophaga sp.]MDZ4283527.1 hypothetical protein [Hydrogenophaga sp.]
MLNNYAIFDTEAGFLQWHGRAASVQAALFVHLKEVGCIDEIADYQFRVLELDDAQYAPLMAWWRAGQWSLDYPPDMPSGEILSAADVIRFMSL